MSYDSVVQCNSCCVTWHIAAAAWRCSLKYSDSNEPASWQQPQQKQQIN